MLLNRRIVAFGPPAEVLQPESLLRAYGAIRNYELRTTNYE